MAELKGWVKIHRKVFDNPVVTASSDHLAVWIYLLCHATPKPYKTYFKGKVIELQPGQLITSRNSILSSFKIRVERSKVERILKSLENEHQIEQQTSNKNRLITILNWDSYQTSEPQAEQQVSNKRATSEQQVSTNREYKNKRIKEDNIYTPQNKEFCVAEYEPIISLFNSILSDVLPRVDRLSPKRIKAIETLKSENIDFKVLFERVRSSSYLTGGGSNGWKADFNWIVDLDHAVRILEGVYDDGDRHSSGRINNGMNFVNTSYDISNHKSLFDD
jgi:hypothetical protein